MDTSVEPLSGVDDLGSKHESMTEGLQGTSLGSKRKQTTAGHKLSLFRVFICRFQIRN